MPRRDGTGPSGQGPGTGRGLGRGQGRSRQPDGFGLGPSGKCVCPSCGETIEVDNAERPIIIQCPSCGTKGMLKE